MSSLKPYNLRVRVTPHIYQQVTEIAAEHNTSLSTVIRTLLIKSLSEIDDKELQPCEREEEAKK